MGKINIEGLDKIDDMFYRYKMPKIEITNEKNKTVILNLDLVAKDLGRNIDMLVMFYKKYYGTNIILKNSKYILCKKIDALELQNSIKILIEYTILCPKCRLPETHLLYEKKVKITCDCCGYNDVVNMNNVNSKVISEMLDIILKQNNKK